MSVAQMTLALASITLLNELFLNRKSITASKNLNKVLPSLSIRPNLINNH